MFSKAEIAEMLIDLFLDRLLITKENRNLIYRADHIHGVVTTYTLGCLVNTIAYVDYITLPKPVFAAQSKLFFADTLQSYEIPTLALSQHERFFKEYDLSEPLTFTHAFNLTRHNRPDAVMDIVRVESVTEGNHKVTTREGSTYLVSGYKADTNNLADCHILGYA